MGKGHHHPFTDMTQRERLFVQLAARRLVRTLVTNVPLMKEAGMEAKDYYNKDSKNRSYWEGWNAAMDGIVWHGEDEIKDLIVSMGGDRKALYVAQGIAEGVRRYEQEMAGTGDPLEITQESFQLFRETV